MSNTTESPYSVTFKTGKGNLFTTRGDTASEMVARLMDASMPVTTDDGPMSVLDVIRDVENSLPGVAAAGAQQHSQDGQGTLHGTCDICGAAVENTAQGTGKYGPWTRYDCPSGDHTGWLQKNGSVKWGVRGR